MKEISLKCVENYKYLFLEQLSFFQILYLRKKNVETL